MAIAIETVEVFGFNGVPSNSSRTVKRARRKTTDQQGDPIHKANQRFGNLHPNWLRITGTDLEQVNGLRLEYTGGTTHHFAVIDMQPNSNENATILDVWFVVWADLAKGAESDLDTGDLTVTVETVAVTETSGEDDAVVIED